MEHVNYPISYSLREPDLVPPSPVRAQINTILADLHQGLPIQYVLGYTFFCDLIIEVNKDVLIPRPETEEMVEHIRRTKNRSLHRIIDLGTGSGCIALALKSYFPDAQVCGADVSPGALSVARMNGERNNLEVQWLELDLLNPIPLEQEQYFDLVVSNPPYVRESERKQMDRRVSDFEPGSALFVPDEDPLIFYRAIATFCKKCLAKNGEIWLEINEQLGTDSAQLFKEEGFSQVCILKDIHGKERYIYAQRQ